jgi:glycosyltransferase involved in cell wall biosynthesis
MVSAVFCWVEVNGYMASCWQALAKRAGIKVSVVAGSAGSVVAENRFGDDLVAGLDAEILDAESFGSQVRVADAVLAHKPDVVLIPGWLNPAFSALAFDRRLDHAKFIMGLDTPRLDNWRQHLARFKVGRLVDRMDQVLVTGERSWQFARRYLRVPEEKLVRGLYGVNHAVLRQAHESRSTRVGGWPKSFVFLGRMIEIKGVDVLAQAYSQYRTSVPDPWPLRCCGTGPLAGMLRAVPGIEDLGFVQPAAMPEILSQQGVFVLPSRYDPWPLVVVEACSAGLPIICSNACGSAVEVVRQQFNGLLVATGSAPALAGALRWSHEHHAELPEMGRRSLQLTEPYSAESWGANLEAVLRKLAPSSSTRW